jgi:hypothetical protein
LLTVHFNYGGNFTALFCHGSEFHLPASLAWEHIYVFPHTGGYDGQAYHLVAHDPLCRMDVCASVPDRSLRYPRILLPGMAYLAALGRQEWIDRAYAACNLLFLFLGAYWLAKLCGRPWLGAMYVLAPASVISLDRMVVDMAVTSLCLGFAVYVKSESPWKLYAVLAAAALCRDVGFVLSAAYVLVMLGQRRQARAALFATAVLPAAAWILWVRTHVPGGAQASPMDLVPIWGLIYAVLHPRTYAYAAFWIRAFEVVQLAGMVLALGIGLRQARSVFRDPVRAACFLWGCLGLMMYTGFWDDPFGGSRVYCGLLLFEFLSGDRWSRWPLAMATPRVWLQMAPQVWGVVRGLL